MEPSKSNPTNTSETANHLNSAARIETPFNGHLSNLAPELLIEFCRRLPKIELHYHVEGGLGVTPESLLKIAQTSNIDLPASDVETLRPHLQVTPEDKSLIDFLKKFETIGKIFLDREVISEIFATTIREAAKENVRYLELRFSPVYIALGHKLSLDEVMIGVMDGVKRGQEETGLKTNLIVIVERQMNLVDAERALELAIAYKNHGVVALDLANDEFNFPPGPFAAIFQEAKAAGLNITVHAGEAAGPENVRTAIEKLGADRIGHGVRSYLDPDVEKLVLDYGIPLELCLTSNVQTQAVDNLAAHPLRHYFDRGVKVTINTDDAGVCGISHADEFYKAIKQFDFTMDEIERILMYSVEAAFVGEQEREELRRVICDEFDRLKIWLAGTLC